MGKEKQNLFQLLDLHEKSGTSGTTETDPGPLMAINHTLLESYS